MTAVSAFRERRMVLVLGMHRSGTSAVAGTLAQLGVDFTSRLVAASKDNPKGYFEHADIWQQDHEILQALGSTWDDPLPLAPGWEQAEPIKRIHARAQATLSEDFARATLGGIKDPRMCRLVPIWRDWLRQEDRVPLAVLAIRRPAEVIASLAKRDQLTADQSAWVWLRHVLESEQATRDMPRGVVRYENLLSNWRSEMRRLASQLDMEFDFDGAAPRVEALLDPELRHHRKAVSLSGVSEPMHGWLERAHAALTGEDAINTTELDRVATEVAAVDDAAAASAQLLRSSRLKSLQLVGELQWSGEERLAMQAGNLQMRENLDRHVAERAAMVEGNEALRANLDRHIAERASMVEGNEALRVNLEHHVTELAQMAEGNAALRANLDRHITERAAMVEGTEALRANLDRHVTEMAKMAEGNHVLRGKLDRHVMELAKMAEDNEALRATLDHHIMEVAEMAEGNEVLRGEIKRQIEERERARDAASALEQQLAAATAQLARIYASRSWRLTRPMRGAIRLLRRPLGRPSAELSSQPVAPLDLPMVPTANERPQQSEPLKAIEPLLTWQEAFARATGPRILIVTPDILGPIRNGGIGTAFAALAQTLARAGRAVTVLYTLGGHSEDGGDIAKWERHYAALGIRFLPIWLERGEPVLDAPHHAWRAYRVYLWLKAQQGDHDLAYFPEWKGEAYFALQAKRMGLDFAALRMMVVTHSSTTWAETGNFVVPQQFDDLLLEFLERRSTEMADAVISPSHYMLDWMRDQGWRWSSPTHVLQNLMPDVDPQQETTDAQAFTITEWVFFGRLERRKGLLIFLAALGQIPADVRAHIQVTFLGKSISTPEFDSLAAIQEGFKGWPKPAIIITDHDRDQALSYLQQPGRVAIIASLVENSPYTVLECVLKRIPFVAADVGGIAELVHPDDRERALFTPTPAGLAGTLVAMDGSRYAPPRPAASAATTHEQWISLQDQLMLEIPAKPVETAVAWPHITVCLVHFDRPVLLAQAIDSLRQQTYAHFDVVLVDDGSSSAEAHSYLDGLHDEFAGRGWTIVRQGNAYLGAARNTAVRHARGDYVMFMDDDNIAKPHELTVFARAARHSNADILTTVSDIFTDTGATFEQPDASRQLWIPLGNAPGLGVFRNVFGDANALVRRSTFEALGGFTEDYGVGHEDWEFFARASLAGANLQLVPEPLFWYRLNGGSMLRAGLSHVDHARSLRPYQKGLPNGVGAALAYASHLHRKPVAQMPVWAMPAPVAANRGKSLPDLWAFGLRARVRFMELLKIHGWRVTLKRTFIFVTGRRDRHRKSP
jgi:glycosyltransferase involved in cell wall biosynthesis